MTSLPFGIQCRAFVLAVTIKVHIKNYKEFYPGVFEMLNNSMYVDFYSGTKTAENAYKVSSCSST